MEMLVLINITEMWNVNVNKLEIENVYFSERKKINKIPKFLKF